WPEADGEVSEMIDLLEWYPRQMLQHTEPRYLTQLPGEESFYRYVPLGAGVGISPWNFPFALTAGMVCAAVVTGNTVVVKPATSSACVARMVELFEEAGVPDGVVNLVTGGGAAGEMLVDHPQMRWVSFTGSRAVGVRIYERASHVHPGQKWLKRMQLEMGGKNV